MRTKRFCLLLAAVPLVTSACGTQDPTTPAPRPTVDDTVMFARVVSGNGQTDTINAVLADPIVFRVESATGRPLAGVRVQYQTNNVTLRSSEQVTDANGQIRTFVTLGDTATAIFSGTYGRASVGIYALNASGNASGFGAGASFTVKVGKPAATFGPPWHFPANLAFGGIAEMYGALIDRHNNPVRMRIVSPATMPAAEDSTSMPFGGGPLQGVRVLNSAPGDTATITIYDEATNQLRGIASVKYSREGVLGILEYKIRYDFFDGGAKCSRCVTY